MTQLELFEDTRRLSIRHMGAWHALRTFIANVQARAALARVEQDKRRFYAEVPDYLRRDLGLPELELAAWPPETIITYMRLK